MCIRDRLHVERAHLLRVGRQIEASHAAARGKAAQRERLAQHGKTVLLALLYVVDQEVGAGLGETVACQDEMCIRDRPTAF